MRTVYHIENRGSDWIFHWLCLMVAGFRHIGTDFSRSGPDGSGLIEQNLHMIKSNTLLPINLWIPTIKQQLTYQKETLDIIGDKYKLVSDVSYDDIIINNYGEFLHDGIPCHDAFVFLRALFLDRVSVTNKSLHRGKKYFISRRLANSLPGNKGISRREIVNESDVFSALQNKGFDLIFLEDFSMREKIEIFREASVIVSPNSGGLTFSLFSSNLQKILEMNVENPSQISQQYKTICNISGASYHNLVTEKIDNNDNMRVNIPLLISSLARMELSP